MSSNRPLHPYPALPSPVSLAHAIRYNAQTCTSLARELGCSDKRISDHLRAGGFNGHGDPIEPTTRPRPRLKDSDTGSPNHVSGGDRAISTNPVQYSRTPSHAREGFDWGDLGPPPKTKSGNPEIMVEPDPDSYVEPPLLEPSSSHTSGVDTTQEMCDSTEQIHGRREALLTDVARPRSRTANRVTHNASRSDQNLDSRNQLDDAHLTGSGEEPTDSESELDAQSAGHDDEPVEAADAPQMRPVDRNEGSNDDANAIPEPKPEQGSRQVRKSLASDFETSNETAGAASRAKSTGHTHGNGGTCRSLHARQFDATAALLLRAKQSERKRIRALGERINDLLIDLRDRLDQEDRVRREKAEAERQREEERAAAKAEVDRLERELREAKARARRHNKGYSRTPSVQHRTEDVRPNGGSGGHLYVGTSNLDQGRAYQRDVLGRHDATLSDVRAWAAANGIECPQKGSRAPRGVLDAFDAAHTPHQDADTGQGDAS